MTGQYYLNIPHHNQMQMLQVVTMYIVVTPMVSFWSVMILQTYQSIKNSFHVGN